MPPQGFGVPTVSGVGVVVGVGVGVPVGVPVGLSVGEAVGDIVGVSVGVADGEDVGESVGDGSGFNSWSIIYWNALNGCAPITGTPLIKKVGVATTP